MQKFEARTLPELRMAVLAQAHCAWPGAPSTPAENPQAAALCAASAGVRAPSNSITPSSTCVKRRVSRSLM